MADDDVIPTAGEDENLIVDLSDDDTSPGAQRNRRPFLGPLRWRHPRPRPG
jgi:hypothetical protein